MMNQDCMHSTIEPNDQTTQCGHDATEERVIHTAPGQSIVAFLCRRHALQWDRAKDWPLEPKVIREPAGNGYCDDCNLPADCAVWGRCAHTTEEDAE